MYTIFLLFFGTNTNLISCALIETIIHDISPFKYLTEFALIPKSQSKRWDGNYGKADFTILHNYESGTFWLAGYTFTSQQWNSFLSASALKYSCQDRLNAATYLLQSTDFNSPNHTSGFFSVHLNTGDSRFKYKEMGSFATLDVSVNSLMTYWAIANCEKGCIVNSTNNYCMGALYASVNIHFTNADSGINREMSYEEIGAFPLTILFFNLQVD
jgi:hypothetical protein